MWFLYILHSNSSHIYYVGISQNPQKRLEQHNHSYKNNFTAKHRPWELKALFECGNTESQARIIETFIKKQKSKKLINTLCDPLFTPTGKLAQLVRVP